jgi:YVTN family beta-propeller protein
MLGFATQPRLVLVVLLGLATTSPAARASLPPSDKPADGDPSQAVYGPLDPQVIHDLWLAAPGGAGHGGEGIPGSTFVTNGAPPEGDTPAGAAFTPNGARFLVAHRDSKNVTVYDAATRNPLSTIPLSGSPNDIAITADGAHAVTANIFEDTASIIDLATASEVAVVPVGNQPGTVRCAPFSNLAVVGNTIDASYSVIDVSSHAEVRRIPGVGFVGLISINFENGAITAEFNAGEFATPTDIVHADFFADQIKIVNVLNGAVVTLSSADQPRNVAASLASGKAVVSHTGTAPVISVVDPLAFAITKTINVFVVPSGPIAVNPGFTKAVVAIQNACRTVNLVTDLVSADLPTLSVNRLVTTGDGNYALGVGFSGSLIAYATDTIVKQLNNLVSTAIGAVSPTNPRAVMIATTFGENMLVVNTNGAAGFIESTGGSGPPPEGDKARTVAVTPDGSRAVIGNILSDNVTIVDLPGLQVEGLVAVGDRPAEVAITPDGTRAVVANLDSDFVSVVDLAARTVTNITISTRGSEVEISPDGQYAYVAVVANDGVWRVNLSTLAVQGPKIATGNMGGGIYAFSQTSGMKLSHDGSTLVTCDSFSNGISVIKTFLWNGTTQLAVPGFPVQAVFSPDDGFIFVSCRDDDRVRVYTNPGYLLAGTIPVGDQPFHMAMDPGGNTLYVENFGGESISVVDVPSFSVVATIPLPDNPMGLWLNGAGTELMAATGTWSVSVGPGPAFSIGRSGQLSQIDTATRLITDQVVTGLPPAELAVSEAAGVAVVASPFGDGITVADLGTALGVGEPAATVSVAGLRIFAPAPNPARDRVTFRYAIGAPGPVTITLHDVAGRRLRTLFQGEQAAGEHVLRFGRDTGRARDLPPGVYFVRAETRGEVRSAKLVIDP